MNIYYLIRECLYNTLRNNNKTSRKNDKIRICILQYLKQSFVKFIPAVKFLRALNCEGDTGFLGSLDRICIRVVAVYKRDLGICY